MAPRGMPLSAGWFGATLPLLYPVPRSLQAALALKIRCLEVDPMRYKHIQTMSGQNTPLGVDVFLPVVYIYIYHTSIPSSNQTYFPARHV